MKFGPQEPPNDYRIWNRKQPDGTVRPIKDFFFEAIEKADRGKEEKMMEKQIITVQREDGSKEFLCPKCNTVMLHGVDLHESSGQGGEYEQTGGEYFYCPNCELVIR